MIDKNAWYKYTYLRAKIIYYDHLYYGEDAPVVTDKEYDTLIQNLKKMEKVHPYFITEDSPTLVPGNDRFSKTTNDRIIDNKEVVILKNEIARLEVIIGQGENSFDDHRLYRSCKENLRAMDEREKWYKKDISALKKCVPEEKWPMHVTY